MKKFLYPFLVVVLLVAGFLAGSWFNRRETKKDIPSVVKSSAVNPAEDSSARSGN